MEENFNIDDYKDYENITLAQYDSARQNVENIALEAAKKGNLKTAWHYAKIYFELSKLMQKRVSFGNKEGYNNKGINR